MKHGMLTVRREPPAVPVGGAIMDAMSGTRAMSGEMSGESALGSVQPSVGVKTAMTVLTFAIPGGALVIAVMFAL